MRSSTDLSPSFFFRGRPSLSFHWGGTQPRGGPSPKRNKPERLSSLRLVGLHEAKDVGEGRAHLICVAPSRPSGPGGCRVGDVRVFGAQRTQRRGGDLTFAMGGTLARGLFLERHHLSEQVGVAAMTARMDDRAAPEDQPNIVRTTFKTSDVKYHPGLRSRVSAAEKIDLAQS